MRPAGPSPAMADRSLVLPAARTGTAGCQQHRRPKSEIRRRGASVSLGQGIIADVGADAAGRSPVLGATAMKSIVLRGGPWEGEPAETTPGARVHYDLARDQSVRYEDSGEIDPGTGRPIFDYRRRRLRR
jgi:hypothetical protein